MWLVAVSFESWRLHTSDAIVAEQEAHDQPDKAESQPAAMPDYAAGLLPPTFDVNVSNA